MSIGTMIGVALGTLAIGESRDGGSESDYAEERADTARALV